MQCPPINRITLGQNKSDNINPMIKLAFVFVYCVGILGPANNDNIKRLVILTVIQLSSGHCIIYFKIIET